MTDNACGGGCSVYAWCTGMPTRRAARLRQEGTAWVTKVAVDRLSVANGSDLFVGAPVVGAGGIDHELALTSNGRSSAPSSRTAERRSGRPFGRRVRERAEQRRRCSRGSVMVDPLEVEALETQREARESS